MSTITPSDRLGITFLFNTERIRCIKQLHKVSIPGRISDSRHSAGQLATINRETSLPGSTDGPGKCDMFGQEGGLTGASMPTHGDRTDRVIEGTESVDLEEVREKQVSPR